MMPSCTHERHSIAHPWEQEIQCLLWAQSLTFVHGVPFMMGDDIRAKNKILITMLNIQVHPTYLYPSFFSLSSIYLQSSLCKHFYFYYRTVRDCIKLPPNLNHKAAHIMTEKSEQFCINKSVVKLKGIHAGLDSLRPNDNIWHHGTWPKLIQVMACCLTAPSHYLSQRWLIVNLTLWNTFQWNHIKNGIFSFKKMYLKVLSVEWWP